MLGLSKLGWISWTKKGLSKLGGISCIKAKVE